MPLAAIHAQQAETPPVVQAALFYSPTCPHCHTVIDDVLPGMQTTYGEQLQIYFVDVSQQGGGALFYQACDALSIPANACGSVPMMIVGDAYLIGSAAIPNQMPGIVDSLLAQGGADLSAVPALADAISVQTGAEAPTDAADGVWSRFQAEPLAMGTGVVVVVGLVLSLVMSGLAWGAIRQDHVPGWLVSGPIRLMIGGALGGGVLVIGGVITSGGGLPTLLAIGIGLLLLLPAIQVMLTQRLSVTETLKAWRWSLPVVMVAGILVAGYLSYVEVGQAEATCGVIGDCNAVQASEYATILGVPVGLIGVAGYVALLLAWAGSEWGSERLQRRSRALMLAFVTFGVVFSIYLTIIELFIIGAMCVWCVTSALIMLALSGLIGPFGWMALAGARIANADAPSTRKRAYVNGR